MDLPPEILGLVLYLLRKIDLKKARHVSKAWEKAAVPYLFNEVFLSPNRGDLDTAEFAINQFGFHIKTLTFSTVYYEPMNWTKFKQEAIRQAPPSLKQVLPSHMYYAYQNYCKVRMDQMGFFEEGTCLAFLCRALRCLPYLQKLVLKDLGSGPIGSMNNLYSDGLAKSLGPCLLTGCQLSRSEHLELLVRPKSGILHPVASSWNTAMLAWWAVGSPVREIAVESQAYLPLGLFANTVQRPFELDQLFQSLTKLRLNLFIDPDSKDSMDTCCFKNAHVSLALSGAKSLQCLYINTRSCKKIDTSKHMTPFQTVLGACQFPKLSSLILNWFGSTMEELLAFLEASKQLQQLTLIGHELLSGTWEQAADWMRSSLALKEADLNLLYGGWEPDSLMADFQCRSFEDYFGHVQDFFLRHGPNPFSPEMLAAREKDLDEGREEVDVDCSVAAEERYQRYH